MTLQLIADPQMKMLLNMTIDVFMKIKQQTKNLAKNKRYDQILYYRNQKENFNDKGGIVDFYQEEWRSLYPEDQFPGMTKRKFTFQLSDHLPLWIQLDVWSDDYEINKLIKKSNQN